MKNTARTRGNAITIEFKAWRRHIFWLLARFYFNTEHGLLFTPWVIKPEWNHVQFWKCHFFKMIICIGAIPFHLRTESHSKCFVEIQ